MRDRVALLVEASALTAPPFSVGHDSDIVADSERKATVAFDLSGVVEVDDDRIVEHNGPGTSF